MPKYLLDTNACIAIRDLNRGKKARDPAALARLQQRLTAVPAGDLAMSLVSMGELRYGAEKSGNPATSHALLDALAGAIQVIGVNTPACREYGALRCTLERAGQKIGNHDNWIAAHALALGMTVVTNNVREFQRVPGLKVEDWTTP